MTINLSQLAILFVVVVALGLACRYLARHGASRLIGPLAFGALSLGAFGLGAKSFWDSYRLVHGAVSTEGEVIRIEISQNTTSRRDANYGDRDESTTTSKPVIRFRPERAGHDVEFTALGNKGAAASYEIGEKVSLLYSPDEPTHARLNIFGDLWLPGIILDVAGSVLAIAALVMWLVGKKIAATRVSSAAA